MNLADMPPYSIVIEWSPEDQAYIVILPEWADRYAMPVGDRQTYEEALASARDALATFIQLAQDDGAALPEPHTYAGMEAWREISRC